LICVIIMEKQNADALFIDSWFMSCRVLKRGMENFVLNAMVAIARKNGFKYIKGQYIPTPKNEMVKDHYADLGFTADGDDWVLDTENYTNKKCFIAYK